MKVTTHLSSWFYRLVQCHPITITNIKMSCNVSCTEMLSCRYQQSRFLSQIMVVKCRTWESILLSQLTLEYVIVLTLAMLGELAETGAGQPMLCATFNYYSYLSPKIF